MAKIGLVVREVYRRPGMDRLPGHLEKRYGIHVTGTERLDAGVLKVCREEGAPWVARLYLSGRPLERTEGDAEVLRFLERQGTAAERLAHPEPVSTMDDGRAVLVTEFVQGSRKPPGSPADWRKLGDMLGRAHTLETEPGPTERPAGSMHHLPEYEGYPDRDLAAAAALLADVEDRVPPEHRKTYEALVELLPKGDGCEGLPQSFVHPDAAPSNLLTTAAGFVLVDWTGAGRGPRLASLAVALMSAGPKHIADFLSGYQSHVELTNEEVDRVEGALWAKPIWLGCWQCWLACVSSKVNKAFVPDGSWVAALAAATRASVKQSG